LLPIILPLEGAVTDIDFTTKPVMSRRSERLKPYRHTTKLEQSNKTLKVIIALDPNSFIPMQTNNENYVNALMTATDMTIGQALQSDRPQKAKQAILAEIKNMIDYSVGFSIKCYLLNPRI
jgi:hypothetical protein